MVQDLAIVLTAAITVSPGSTAVTEASVRRQQYLIALRYYAHFAPVYFLENSGYDLQGDAEFSDIPGVKLRAIAAQDNEARGKGYREFHALDIWFENEQKPPKRIVKITGRYMLDNIAQILRECSRVSDDMLLFDRYRSDRMALTGLFSITKDDYAKYIRGIYREVNDPAGIWIEHVVYRAIARAKCETFQHEPDVSGISGTSGRTLKSDRAKFMLRQITRSLNRIITRRFLYLRGTTFGQIKKLVE